MRKIENVFVCHVTFKLVEIFEKLYLTIQQTKNIVILYENIILVWCIKYYSKVKET